MGDRHTSIVAPDGNFAFSNYGRKTRADMIAQFRQYAATQFAEAQKILNTKDEDFIVETYIGMHRRTKVESVQ